MTDARSLIMGTSSPAMSFNYRGDKIVGKVLTEPKAVQQTVFDPRNPQSKTPAFWPSGDPKMQVIFQVETQWRNHEGINNPDRAKPDNGVRTIYLKGKHMERATADAVRTAGADWIAVGGMISFEYIGDDATSVAPIKPKLFAVAYRPPAQQPPQHFQAQQGYPNQGHPAQQPPRPPQQANPAEQYARWQAEQQRAQQAQAVQVPAGNDWGNDPWATPTPVAPPHHGSENSMPDWAAAPQSAPPVSPASAPPSLSTLDMIRQAGQSDPGGFDANGAGF